MIILVDYDGGSTSFKGNIADAIKLFRRKSNTYIRLECKHHRAGSFNINRLWDDSLSFDWVNFNNRGLQ
jgi:hypothetical protein